MKWILGPLPPHSTECLLHLFLYILSFAYHAVLDIVLLFHRTGFSNQLLNKHCPNCGCGRRKFCDFRSFKTSVTVLFAAFSESWCLRTLLLKRRMKTERTLFILLQNREDYPPIPLGSDSPAWYFFFLKSSSSIMYTFLHLQPYCLQISPNKWHYMW